MSPSSIAEGLTPLAGTKRAPSCTLVICGARGDLTKRLLLPALKNLADCQLLPADFQLIGIAREPIEAPVWHPDQPPMVSIVGDLADPATYAQLEAPLAGRSAVFHLAVPPALFGDVVDRLGGAGLLRATAGQFRRVVIEKPFGRDLASATALDARIHAHAAEEQVFRIDHFLGKEPVQSIIALRFANVLFERAWCADAIDHVQITAAETLGVEKRAAFYEDTGALRDMAVNHLLQLACMVGMEQPTCLDADAIRSAKTEFLRAIRPLAAGDIVRGQYRGYRAEPGVAPDSGVETYLAARLTIDTPRWRGVPFYLRTGKKLRRRRTEIVLRFKPPSRALFPDRDQFDLLRIMIDPEHGIAIRFDVKVPGPELVLGSVTARLSYDETFDQRPNVGYETLLYDVMTGDSMLFQRADTILASWTVVDPVLHCAPTALAEYEPGTDGPDSADALLAADGRAWLPLVEAAQQDTHWTTR